MLGDKGNEIENYKGSGRTKLILDRQRIPVITKKRRRENIR